MRLLLDENLSLATARLLREAGHDATSVKEEAPGASDPDVIALARATGRVLVTFDSDIGGRLFLHGDPAPVGVLYLRFVQSTPSEAAILIRAVLSGTPEGVIGRYVTVSRERVRVQALPHP